MLHFRPTIITPETAVLTPEDALGQLARTRCAKYPSEAHHPKHPDYRSVISEVNRSESDIKDALVRGELIAVTWLEPSFDYFEIPVEYWKSVLSTLNGRIFAFPADNIVPPQFDERPIVIRSRDWLGLLANMGIESWDLAPLSLFTSSERISVLPKVSDLTAANQLPPWLTAVQALALIATGDQSYVAGLARLEAERIDEIQLQIVYTVFSFDVAEAFCRCNAQSLPSSLRPEHCTCIRDAGLSLLEAIRVGNVRPTRRTREGPKPISFYDLAGVGLAPNGNDWIAAGIGLQISSAELKAANLRLTGEQTPSVADHPITRTGDPGRPALARHLYEAKHAQRCSAGEAQIKIKDEAKDLLEWLKTEHRAIPLPTVKTIGNTIASAHRAYTTALAQNDHT